MNFNNTYVNLKALLITIIPQIFGSILIFSNNVLLSKNLEPESLGQYFFIISILVFFSILINLGLGRGIVRNFYYFKQTSIDKSSSMINSIFIFSFFSALILCTLLYIVFSTFDDVNFFNFSSQNSILYAILCIIPLSISFNVVDTMKAFRNLFFTQFYNVFLSQFLFFIFLFFTTFNLVDSAITYYFFAILLTSVFGTLHCYYLMRGNIKKYDFAFIKHVFDSSKHLLKIQLILYLQSYASIIVINFLSTSQNVAFFNIPFKIAQLVTYITIAISIIFAPRFSSIYYEKNFNELNKIFKSSILLSILFSAILTFLIIFFGKQILQVFSIDYVNYYNILVLLALAQCIFCIFGQFGTFFIATNNEKLFSNAIFISTSIFLSLLLILTYYFEIYGAAIAFLISSTIYAFINLFLYLKLKRTIYHVKYQ